ncbi:MAG: trigger factor [Lachnospiraceae bacterium]|nr:trigger factor [Lachnospiraceae bacterium]
MKKRMILGLCVGLAVVLSGCGAKNEEVQESTVQESAVQETEVQTSTIYLSSLDVTDLVELGEYKGIEVQKQSTEVPESMVDSYMEYTMSFQSELAPVTDRDVVENGDTVTIDYEGKKDGVAFDGGTATDYNLSIGSGTFIEGFEDGLIGVKKGETVDLNLTFPESYPAEDLAGADVIFTVTVKEIQAAVTPTLDDEYVAGLGIEGVETVEDYRQTVHEMLTQQMEEEAEYQLQVSIIEAVMANSTIQEPSEELKQKYADVAARQTQKAAEYYGMDMETYVFANYGVELAEYESEIQAGAYEAARQALLCKRIADEEGIVITDEKLEEVVNENYAGLGYASAEDFKAAIDLEEYRDSILLDEVLKFLVDNAVVAEEDHTGHDHE